MPNPRGTYFAVSQRQDRWWLDLDEDRRAIYAERDAAPLPTEPQRERSGHGNRLAFRLRMIIRPSDRALR